MVRPSMLWISCFNLCFNRAVAAMWTGGCFIVFCAPCQASGDHLDLPVLAEESRVTPVEVSASPIDNGDSWRFSACWGKPISGLDPTARYEITVRGETDSATLRFSVPFMGKMEVWLTDAGGKTHSLGNLPLPPASGPCLETTFSLPVMRLGLSSPPREVEAVALRPAFSLGGASLGEERWVVVSPGGPRVKKAPFLPLPASPR